VTWLTDGASAVDAMQENTADLVLLDLGLPGKDGLDVLIEARQNHIRTPVLILTARDAVQARIHGLDAGADDYLTKPFHLDELAARIRSLTRRMQGLAANRIETGALCLDLATLEVTFHGTKVDLTRKELTLLQTLMERTGRLVRRDTLESSLYGSDKVVGDGALDVLVHSLRRKLSFDTIQNVRAFGYMIPREPR
jgi:two-component system response regulator QseB